jgi:plasmid maintenance system antidote protein VapI
MPARRLPVNEFDPTCPGLFTRDCKNLPADTALRLARYFKTSPAFWLNLQTPYDLEVMGGREADRIAQDVRPLEVDATREA